MDRLNVMENEMKSEIQKLLKAVNVSCGSEVTETALNKLHKPPLVKFVSTFLNLVEKNVELCKCAAGKMDILKSEKIADQKRLIDIQQEQINSVQETVKSEMKSWADVVQKNTAQRSGKHLTENSVKQALRTVDEEKRRSKNFMIYGYPESEKEVNFELNRSVKNIIECTDMIPAPRTCDIQRIGRKELGKNRPIKVQLESASDVDYVLTRARNLKNFTDYINVYLGPDRTREEQLAHNKLVKQMKQMIEKNPNKHYYIRNRKIYIADKGLSAQTSQSS